MPSQVNIIKQDDSVIKQDTQKFITSQQEKLVVDLERDKFPPNMQDARKHGRATKCAKEIHGGPKDICLCCGLNVYNEKLMVCDDRKSLSFLGTGFPLFFDFVRWTQRILILAFIFYGLYAILSNAAGGDCINALNTVQGELKDACCQANAFGNTECSKTKIIDESFCDNLIENQIDGLEHICASSSGFQSLNDCCQKTCIQNDQRCHQQGIHPICLPNKQNSQKLRMVQSIILICFVIIFKIIMVIMRRHQRQTELDCDITKVSPSDFTAIIRNLPSNQYDEQSLRHAIEGYCEALDPLIQVEIVRIILSYEVHEYIETVRQLNYHTLEINKANNYLQNKGKYPPQIPHKQFILHQYYHYHLSFLLTFVICTIMAQQINILIHKKGQLDQLILQNRFKKTSTLAFVTFKSKNGTNHSFLIQIELDQILSKAQISPLKYYLQQFINMIRLNKLQSGFLFQGNLLSFERAPEPDDVFWENCGVSQSLKIWHRSVTYLMAFIILIFSFGLVLILKYAQMKMINKSVTDKFSNQGEIKYSVVTALSFISSLVIILTNKILGIVIQKFSLKEYHTTRTNYMITSARQMIFFQFVNSALIIIAANVLINTLYLQNQGIDQEFINRIAFERNGGVVDDFFQIATQNSIGPALVTYLNLRNCFKVLKKWKIYGKVDDHECITTQAEANKIFEGNQIDLVGYYTQVLVTVYITFFYASLVPMALIVSFFGLIFYYWVQKYQLAHDYTRPFPIANFLNNSMLNMLQYTTVLMALGSIWFDHIFNETSGSIVQILNYVALVISLNEFFLNGDWFLKIIFFNRPRNFLRLETFESQQQAFTTDYDRQNPITKQSALESYLQQFHHEYKDEHISLENNIITGLLKYSKNGGTANHNFNLSNFLWTQEIQQKNQDQCNQQLSEKQINFTTDIYNFPQSQGIIYTQQQSQQKIQKIELQPSEQDQQVSLLKFEKDGQ